MFSRTNDSNCLKTSGSISLKSYLYVCVKSSVKICLHNSFFKIEVYCSKMLVSQREINSNREIGSFNCLESALEVMICIPVHGACLHRYECFMNTFVCVGRSLKMLEGWNDFDG